MGPASPVPGLSCRKQMKGKADMKKRVISILLALVMAFGLCVPALAADEFEAEGPATPVEEEIPAVTEEETEDVPDPVAGSTDLVVLGDSSGITGYSHIGIGSMHSFVIGLATDYVLTTNLGTIDEILYTCNIRTGAVTGQVSISYTGASPLVVTVTKEPGSYPVPLEIHYDPIDLLTDADTDPKYALPGSLLLIEVKDGYEINPDSRNFTILEDSRGSAGRVLQIFISKSATELNITSDSVVAPTPTPVPTPTPAPTARSQPPQREQQNQTPRRPASQSVDGFLRQLLPADFDTGDLMVVLLLLLIAGDNPDQRGNALMTLLLYLMM